MKRIKLTKGQYALVSDEDYEELNKVKWFALQSRGVKRFDAARNAPSVKGKEKVLLMHRVIMNTPQGLDTDHINHNPLDNRRENLRICTHGQNISNQIKSI